MTQSLAIMFALVVRCALAAFAAASIVAYPLFRLLQKTSSQKVSSYAPDSHQLKQGTPTMGGVISLVGILTGIGFAYWNLEPASIGDGFFAQTATAQAKLIVASLLIVLFALIGFMDDYIVPRFYTEKRGLGWRQKLLMQIVAVALALWLPYRGIVSWESFLLTAFIILFFSNAFNFADGLDGLSGGLAIVICAGFSALALYQPREAVVWSLAAVIAASLIPFLLLNAPPAKVFMGDVGALPMGALLGFIASDFFIETRQDVAASSFSDVSSWQVHGGHTVLMTGALVISVIMIAELVPVALQILWVKAFKRKLFSYTPIHHAFEVHGVPESKVVWSFVLVQLALCLIALGVAVRFMPIPDGGGP